MCLLPLVAMICLASPENFSVVADASIQAGGDFSYSNDGHNYGGAHVGRLAFEMQAPISSGLTLRYGWAHTSLLDTNADRGEERIYAGFTWRPFR